MSRLRRLLLLTGLTAGAVVGPALAGLAATTSTAEVGTATEAWYRATPACALPTGCADAGAVPSPYPPATLHVGVQVGVEEARTLLQLDLAALPAGTQVTGGTLLLPVDPDPSSGTRAPETAALQACAVAAPVEEADGSFAAPPQADCSATARAQYVAAQGDAPPAFVVDLAPLAQAWRTGPVPGALALLPADGTAPPATWHVALSQRERPGGVPVRATLSFASAALDLDDVPAPAVPAPAFASGGRTSLSFGAPLPQAASLPELALPQAVPAPAAAAPSAPAPATAAVPSAVPVAAVVDASFRYPAVFLLPLALAAGAGWLGRALTRDLAAD